MGAALVAQMAARFLALLLLCTHVATAQTVWPQPASFVTTPGSIIANPPEKGAVYFHVCDGAKSSSTLDAAMARYEALTFPHVVPAPEIVPALCLNISSTNEDYPQLNTDESYSLSVGAESTMSLSAATVFGAMRGLETFSQLVLFNFTSEQYYIPFGSVEIKDAPRFPHRGLMVDTARHFETLASLKAIVASLAYSKINVLHWHISDSQSFPMQSFTHPKLWNGAFSDQERYTQADISTIVEWARLHGVRVIVEFDMPGHAASWCAGYPEVCPSSTCTQPLNVASNKTFELITDLLGEMTGGKTSAPGAPSGLFPDNFIHLGGDEVNTKCWDQVPSVSSWLKARNLTADQGYAVFVKRAAEIAMSQGRRPVQWSEVFDHFKTELDKRTIVHIWKSVTNVTEVVADGYNVLLNVGYDATSWYLDNLNVNWSAVYKQDPCGGSPPELCKLILGGHGEMWGETVDMSDLEQTVWPRLAAIGEKLWSADGDTKCITTALPRLESFRCLLNRRGVHAAPVNNANARGAPPGPGSCYKQ